MGKPKRRLGLLAALAIALLAGALPAQTDPAIEAERARLQQEQQRLEQERRDLETQRQEQQRQFEEQQRQAQEQQQKQQADLEAERQRIQQEQQAAQDALNQQQQTDQAALAAERQRLADEARRQNEDFDRRARELDDQAKKSQDELAAKQKEMEEAQKKSDEELAKKQTELEAQKKDFEAKQQAAADEAKKKQEEAAKPPKELPPLAPDPKPPRRVIEINADTVLGGELSNLWNAFKSKHPEMGLDDLGHQTNIEGATIVGGYRIDSLPNEWITELLALAKELGLSGENPDASMIVAPPGGAAGVIAAESARFQAESAARQASETARAAVEAENSGRPAEGTDGGAGGPTAIAERGPNSPGSSTSENVPDLGGNSAGSSNTTTGTGAGSDPSGSDRSGDAQTANAGNTPPDLAARGIQTPTELTQPQKSLVTQALSFIPGDALKGRDGGAVNVVFEQNPSDRNPKAAGTWEFDPEDPPPTVYYFPKLNDLEDPVHGALHELTHQWIEQRAAAGTLDKFNQALQGLSASEREAAMPSRYAAGDSTGGHEQFAEMLSFYLRGKNSEFTGEKYAPPASVKAIFDEMIRAEGGNPPS